MVHRIVPVLLAAVLMFTGCGGPDRSQIAPAASAAAEAPAASPVAAPPAKDGHGNVAAVPGSYEDWCGEHEVPESQCTRCNNSLIPAFKATKDWCVEHDLPESQCLKCDPKRKFVRPAKPAGK